MILYIKYYFYKNNNKTIMSSCEPNGINFYTLKKFKEATPRKMTLHIISDNKEDCKGFAEFLSGEKFSRNSNELLEKNIIKKKNLYSFINYVVYDNVPEFRAKFEQKIELIKQKKSIFSEVILVLNNPNMQQQIDAIQNSIRQYKYREYLYPFVIVVSPFHVNLNGFNQKKAFKFTTSHHNVKNFKNRINNINREEYEQIADLFRKINVLFSYYNELGDEFSFIPSGATKEKPVEIIIDEDIDIPVYINILLMGKSHSGKSTLLNLILDEKKSIEGGNSFSTTSKNLIVYKKSNVPIRFYDVKGIEDEHTVRNYSEILKDHNGNTDFSKDAINAIFYCFEYSNGILIQKIESTIFEELTKFDIPILFIITKYDLPPNEEVQGEEREARDAKIETIKDDIRGLIKESFIKRNCQEKFEDFMKNYVKIFFVNLVRVNSQRNPIPIFGIRELLSFFTQSVPLMNWEELKRSCLNEDESSCLNYSSTNPFLKGYSNFKKIKKRNKEEALKYLNKLKIASFFSGIFPFVDCGMEYLYRNIFKEKLQGLYGFDIDEAKKVETTVDNKITNKVRNTGCVIRGIGEIGGTIIKALPTQTTATTGILFTQAALRTGTMTARLVVSEGVKWISWAFLPVTCLAFGAWSVYNCDKDCNDILNIFDEAFIRLRFKTLLGYINSFQKAINYFDDIWQKILRDDGQEIE